jgi:hypothetical protein
MPVLNHKKVLSLDKPNLSNAFLNSIVLLETRTSIKVLIEFCRKVRSDVADSELQSKDIEFKHFSVKEILLWLV